MGLYSGGLILRRIFASEILRAYFQEGLFLEGFIIIIRSLWQPLINMWTVCNALVIGLPTGGPRVDMVTLLNLYFPTSCTCFNTLGINYFYFPKRLHLDVA